MGFGPQTHRSYAAENLIHLNGPDNWVEKDMCFVLKPLFNEAFKKWITVVEQSPLNKLWLSDFIKFGDIHPLSRDGHSFLFAVLGKVVILHAHEESLIPDYEVDLMTTQLTFAGNDAEAICSLIGQFRDFIEQYGLDRLKQETREHLNKACFGYTEVFHPAIQEFYSL